MNNKLGKTVCMHGYFAFDNDTEYNKYTIMCIV